MGAEEALVAVGMSHRTAPVAVRERLALDEEGVRRHLRRLAEEGICDEAMLLSTCNRVELYAVPRAGREDLARYLHAFRGPDGEPVDRHLYWHQGQDAVRHLFRVAASLDSLVVGEPQILGQVKEAVRVAEVEHTLGRVLTRLAHRGLRVAKRVRTETDIGRYRVGVGNAGVDLASQIFGTLDGRRALLLGTGEMGRQVAQALLSAGLSELVVSNRSHERAVELARAFGGTPIAWDRVAAYLPLVDVVIAATGATRPVISADMVRAAVRERRYRSMFLVDLSVPRNVDPAAARVEEAYLFNIDDLSRIVVQGQEAREHAARDAEALVADEASRFMRTLAEVDLGPRLGALTRKAETLRLEELERSRRLLGELDADQRAALDAMTRALVKKVLHGPLTAIRAAAREGDAARVRTLLEPWESDDD